MRIIAVQFTQTGAVYGFEDGTRQEATPELDARAKACRVTGSRGYARTPYGARGMVLLEEVIA